MPKLIGDKPLTNAERTKRWRENNPERAKEVQQRYKERNPTAHNEAVKRHYQKNKEQSKARTYKYRKENPDVIKHIASKSYYKNRDARQAAMREWDKSNPDKIARKNHKRRTLAMEAITYIILDKEYKRLLTNSCYNCGSNQNQSIDHIIPLSKGGTNGIGNLQTLCRKCNSSKKDKFMVEWLRKGN